MKKRVIVTHFTVKIIRTYPYVTCNKKIIFLEKYQPISGVIGMNYHTHNTHAHAQMYVHATLFLRVRIISEAGACLLLDRLASHTDTTF